ncbi:hypothetical protein DAERI_110113 [Deinococcus aerius]|uniref:Uncharacterized protein n=1 Tax=Deinococcus aerius TaxID=200253 RepID=A0A2I9DP66_9DEIO|nr:hypothetical protein [Deinococcus aerius]GBF06931.1 hypothetical protein DAERI_110113 [Deinococcus aerius]
MAITVFIDAPFSNEIHRISEQNMFAFGLFVWISEKLRGVMSSKYGDVETNVIFACPKGICTHYIRLEISGMNYSDYDNGAALTLSDEIYQEAQFVMKDILSSAYLAEYLEAAKDVRQKEA